LIDDIACWQAKGGYQQCNHVADHTLFWPERAFRPELSILVAGCGTSEAAVEAYNNPSATVVGIDFSPASLDHVARLKKKHSLDNLELHEMDLRDVASLGRSFDHIVSFGVLHATPSTEQSLLALKNVLKDDGVILLALYSQYMRHGVYMIQEALRHLGVEQTSEDVAFTHRLLKTLPAWHPVQDYICQTDDLGYNAGIVDTFLHKVDRAYTVRDILGLASTCGLDFQCWYDNLYYYPEGAFGAHEPIYDKIVALPEQQQWVVTELLRPSLRGHHRFLLRKQGGDPSRYRIDFENSSALHMVPDFHHRLKTSRNNKGLFKKGRLHVMREWHSLELQGLDEALFLSVNGGLTLGEILARHAPSVEDQAQALQFFKRMWRLGHFVFAKGCLLSG
jgi:SAM-dependent methyltransferase